jgi:hypothetical protein
MSVKTVEDALLVFESDPSPTPLVMVKLANCGLETLPEQAAPVLATLQVTTGVIVAEDPYVTEEVFV